MRKIDLTLIVTGEPQGGELDTRATALAHQSSKARRAFGDARQRNARHVRAVNRPITKDNRTTGQQPQHQPELRRK